MVQRWFLVSAERACVCGCAARCVCVPALGARDAELREEVARVDLVAGVAHAVAVQLDLVVVVQACRGSAW